MDLYSLIHFSFFSKFVIVSITFIILLSTTLLYHFDINQHNLIHIILYLTFIYKYNLMYLLLKSMTLFQQLIN
jgi:hypothetical protein